MAVIIFTSQHSIFYHSECIHVKVFFDAECFSGKISERQFAPISYVLLNMLLSFFLLGELTNAFLLSLTGNGSNIPPIYPVYVELIWELI
jgi:hypothetical protein